MAYAKFGFIGTGNMGSALVRAVRKSADGEEILLADSSAAKASALAEELGCRAADNMTVASEAKYIFLGVKPQMMSQLLSEIAPVLAARGDRFVLITMAAGLKISQYKEMLGAKYPMIRIMPNTPVSIGEGVILYSFTDDVFMDEISDFSAALSKAGVTDHIDEKLIDAASAVSGCGPAFVYIFAEAMADAAVECGLPRAKAIEYAARTISGAGKLITSTGRHPAELKDDVCSPGGTTIAGVHALENAGFRAAVMDAVKAAFEKNAKL